jgi:hypothetical protein
MAVPTSRSDFKAYVLRSLGRPAIEINVTDEQIDDRVDQALKYYTDYHFDATDKQYYRYQLTQTDIDNKYITMPENIIGAINIFDIGSSLQTQSLFSVQYQFALNDMYRLASGSLVPYYMARQQIELFQQVLIGKQPIRYTRHTNRLYIDMNWDIVGVDTWIVVECYQVIDPDTYTDVWGDRWLFLYTKQLIKQQWGENMKKFTGMVLPGGVQMNGQVIYDEATAEIAKMEEEMIKNYSPILSDIWG